MNALFVTGTDTGVGKSVISAIILKELLSRGLKSSAFKPVETGCGSSGVAGAEIL